MSDDNDNEDIPEPVDEDGNVIQLENRPEYVARAKKGHRQQGRMNTNIAAMEKQRKALALRQAGASYAQIAEATGYKSEASARNAVRKAMEKVEIEGAGELRQMQFLRLNQLLMVMWPQAQAGDARAVQVCQGLIQDINQMMGVNEPTEVKHTHEGAIVVVDGDEQEYIKNLQIMAAKARPEAPPAIESGNEYDDDIVDAEIIDEASIQDISSSIDSLLEQAADDWQGDDDEPDD